MRYATLLMVTLMGIASVSAAHGVSLDVGSATGAPGDTVTFAVTLNAMGAAVGGYKDTVTVDPSMAFMSCTRNASLPGAGGTSLDPNNCTPGSDCTSGTTVFASASPTGIRDHSTLYTCDVVIGEETPPGTYPLTISDIDVSDTTPMHIDATGTDGFVEVVLPTETPTPTETPLTPVPTATVTPTLTVTPIPTDTPVVVPMSCSVVAPAESRPAWLLLLPAAVLLGFRRRRDH